MAHIDRMVERQVGMLQQMLQSLTILNVIMNEEEDSKSKLGLFGINEQ